jgi:hypothetical protein
MAHALDHMSQKDISKLRKSPSTMNPKSHATTYEPHAKTLVSNFLSSNPNWSLDSLYDYCMRQYADYGVSNSIISQCVKEYIEAKIH